MKFKYFMIFIQLLILIEIQYTFCMNSSSNQSIQKDIKKLIRILNNPKNKLLKRILAQEALISIISDTKLEYIANNSPNFHKEVLAKQDLKVLETNESKSEELKFLN